VYFFCVGFACFHAFLGLNYVLHCHVSAGMYVVVVCSLFIVPFAFLLAPLFVRFLGGAFTLSTFPLCAPVTRLTSLAAPRQTLFSFVFWLFGRAQTTDNGHPRLALPPSRVPTLDYVPLHPCTPMNAHHGHT
jgi:hypothetical protein